MPLPRKQNVLKEMKIMEVSLVDTPASPDADIIFTKRDGLVGEAVALLKSRDYDVLVGEAVDLLKAFDPNEPRDGHGRWIHEAIALLRQGARDVAGKVVLGASEAAQGARRAAGAAGAAARTRIKGIPIVPVAIGLGVLGAAAVPKVREHAKQQTDEAVQFLHGQAKVVAAHIAGVAGKQVKEGVHLVTHTRGTGLHPVAGGGVQFDFEHGFSSGAKLSTKVQLRPEHLADRPVTARYLARTHKALLNANRPLVDPFNTEQYGASAAGLFGGSDGQAAGTPRFSSWYRQHRTEAPTATGGFFGRPQQQSGSFSTVNVGDQQPHAAVGAQGLPLYFFQNRALPPEAQDVRNSWEKTAHPPGYGAVDKSERPIPLALSTWRQSKGWPYYSAAGDFIPQVRNRPDAQAYMEAVHSWLHSNPDRATAVKEQLGVTNYADLRGGAGFVRLHDENGAVRHHFFPPGDNTLHLQLLRQYNDEINRLRTEKGDPAIARDNRIKQQTPPGVGEAAQRAELVARQERAEQDRLHHSDVSQTGLILPGQQRVIRPGEQLPFYTLPSYRTKTALQAFRGHDWENADAALTARRIETASGNADPVELSPREVQHVLGALNLMRDRGENHAKLRHSLLEFLDTGGRVSKRVRQAIDNKLR